MELPETVGRYRVTGLLGRGGMGTVYRARDETIEREVALKLLTEESDPRAVARFLREARAAAGLQHPNIITVYELGEHAGQPFIAMELLEGLDLQRALEGALPRDPRVALTLLRHVLAGLGHAHERGIVHRDVKPSNVFVPGRGVPKLLDFGLARRGAATTATSGSFAGTPHYLSPEQVRDEELDGRSDLFSAGLVLYELLTGTRAFVADTLVALVFRIAHERPDLSALPPGPEWEPLRRILVRALARQRDERYPDAAAFRSDVESALRGFGGPREWTPIAAGVANATGSLTAATPVFQHTQGASAPTPAAASRLGTYILLGAAAAGAVALLALAAMLWLLLRSPDARPAASPPAATGGAPPPTRPGPALEHGARPAASATALEPAGPAPAPARSTAPETTPSAGVASTPTPKPPQPAPPTRGESVEALLARGEAAFARRHYASARDAARDALRIDPTSLDAGTLLEDAETALAVEEHLKNARAALARGDGASALAEVRAGLAIAPTDGRLAALERELTGARHR